ncbi:MAG: type II secretion system F family protein [Candidatus Paceibacterota bacterium]|jgi:type IV pilus assembly protein PilC
MKYNVTIRKEGIPDQTRTIDAASHFAVYDQIQKEGGVVVNLTDKTDGFSLPSWFFITVGTGIKHREIIRITKNISAMLSAGLSLARALLVIERQSGNKRLKKIIMGLSDSIKKGLSFHESLQKYPKIFPEIFVAMARAGEESGSLADSLTVVGLQMEHSEELVRKIKGAMIYPAIILFVVAVIGFLMLIYVVPTLTSTFNDLGVQVPLATRVIVGVSNFMIAHTISLLVALVVFILGSIVFARSKIGGSLILKVSLYIPIIGELVRETYTARASRTLSSLLSAGVPILDALSITKEVVHVRAYADVIEEAEMRVKKGELLSASFTLHTQLYPILMSEMLLVGEETGKVAQMLKQIAEFYEGDVSEKTKNLSTVIEPVLMLFIGVFVGIFAIAMIAPIYQLSSAF